MKRYRRRTSKKFRWIIIIAVITISLIYFSRRFYKYLSARYEEKSLKKQILILQAENEVLKNRIHQYKRGTILEAKARDELGMIRKGEKVYLVPRK